METFFGIAKELVQTPGGLRKAIIVCLKLLLTLVTGHSLIGKLLGEAPLAISAEISWDRIGEMGFTAILAILAFVLGWFITELLCSLLELFGLVRRFFSKGTSRKLYKELLLDILPYFLRKLKIAQRVSGQRQYVPMENVHRLRAFIEEMRAGKADEIAESLASSLGYQLMGLMLAFLVEYWLFFGTQESMIWVTVILVPAILVLWIVTNSSRTLTEEAMEVLKQLEPLAAYLQIKDWVKLTMPRFGLYDSGERVKKIDYVILEHDRKIFLIIPSGNVIVRLHHVSQFWQRHRDACYKAIIFAPEPPTSDAISFAKKTYGRLILVHADSEEAVIDAFYDHFG